MTVSLPTKWVKKNGVQKGDEVNLEEENNRIIVGVNKSSRKRLAEIDITGLSRSAIMFYLRSIYRQGYDEVVIHFKNPKTIYYDLKKEEKVISVIHQEINRLIGFEVTQQREDFCVIKDLSGPSEGKLDIIIKRILFLLKDAIDDSVEAIKNKNYDKLETIEEKHDTITKFISYCLRMFNKRPDSSPENIHGLYHILCSLDVATDTIKYFARYVIRQKPAFSKKSILILENLRGLSSYTREILFDLNLNKVIEFMKLRADTKDLLDELMIEGKKKDVSLVFYLASMLELMRDLIEAKMSITPPKNTREISEE